MKEPAEFTDDRGHLSGEGIALYVDALKLGTIDQLPGTMRAHIADCDRCQKEVTGLFAVLRSEDYSGLKEHPYFRLERKRDRAGAVRVWRMAAVIATLLLLPAIGYYVFVRTAADRGQPPGVAIAPRDTAGVVPPATGQPPSGGRHELAANFTQNPELEQLVTGGMRSTTLADVVPEIGAAVNGAAIRFDWGPHSRQAWTLVVMDAAGREVYSARIRALPHRAGKKLGAGLYYWKVLDEEEAVYFGKFIVRAAGQSPRSTKPAQK